MTYLGQHFLINRGAIQKIIDELNIQPNETIIEIGPGHGELTKHLAVSPAKKIIAIEKDFFLAKDLKAVTNNKNVEILQGDALKDLEIVANKIKKYKLAGNIPYYITGHLLRIISELKYKPDLTILTIQKEVAERITAEPPEMNLLAAATQFWSDPKIVFRLKQNDFSPPPEIESAIIRLQTKKENAKSKEKDNFYKIIHVIFKQPRKTLLNNLRADPNLSPKGIKKAFETLEISPKIRPQDLSLDQVQKLAGLLT